MIKKHLLTKKYLQHLKKGVIKETVHKPGGLLSPIFVTTKKDGGFRLSLNLKRLNECIEYIHFNRYGLLENLRKKLALWLPWT